MTYPTACLSMYCGKVLCDGCKTRPLLVAYYTRTNQREDYEEGQDRLRADKEAKRGIWAEAKQ